MFTVLFFGNGPQTPVPASEFTGLPERATAKRVMVIGAEPSFLTVTDTSKAVPAVTVSGQITLSISKSFKFCASVDETKPKQAIKIDKQNVKSFFIFSPPSVFVLCPHLQQYVMLNLFQSLRYLATPAAVPDIVPAPAGFVNVPAPAP